MITKNTAIIADAKKEYTTQLITPIKRCVYQCFKELYDNSKAECVSNNTQQDTLSYFQDKIENVPKWDDDIINREYNKLYIKCDWIGELLTAVFMSHTYILSSIHNDIDNDDIQLDIPDIRDFIHTCYVDVAREIYKSPNLFDDGVDSEQYQKNRRNSEIIIENTLNESLRKQLPIKHLLKQYLDKRNKLLEDAKVEQMVKEEDTDVDNKLLGKMLDDEKAQEDAPDADADADADANVLDGNVLDGNVDAPDADAVVLDKDARETTKDIKNIKIKVEEIDDNLGLDLDLDMEDMTDVTSLLCDGSPIYGLDNDEDIKQVVEQELQKIENSQLKQTQNQTKTIEIKDIVESGPTKVNKENYSFIVR